MSKFPLKQRVKFWQRQLRLMDWDIEASWTNEFEHTGVKYSDGEPLGGINVDHLHKTAQLYLVREGWDDADYIDQEFCVIHELLHIVFHELMEAEDELSRTKALEKAINQITKVLKSCPRC